MTKSQIKKFKDVFNVKVEKEDGKNFYRMTMQADFDFDDKFLYDIDVVPAEEMIINMFHDTIIRNISSQFKKIIDKPI